VSRRMKDLERKARYDKPFAIYEVPIGLEASL
jgi:hypothetical protein